MAFIILMCGNLTGRFISFDLPAAETYEYFLCARYQRCGGSRREVQTNRRTLSAHLSVHYSTD